MARARRKRSGFFAWSDIHNGGETKVLKLPRGVTREVVTERNITKHGESVTQDGLGVSDEEWQHLLDSGSVREYEPPDGTDENTSPTRAFLASVTDDHGDIDPNKIMGLVLQNPLPPDHEAMNPPAEEGKELETAPQGA